jgi:DNA-binding response OmpR family regulator
MKKIMLINDNPLMRRSQAYNLERAGYKTFTAPNEEDGLESLRYSLLNWPCWILVLPTYPRGESSRG